MTMREQALHAMKLYPIAITASSLAQVMGVKLSSLSSLLKKMADANEIIRIKNIGPRGGYGYRMRRDSE